ncbi:helix-turn-helix domain-containing protein [Actinomadura viridis]|uniref:helix-turn-helix domain-containing protein n=1 Tax=Actinomadura viridis TaxID=58110 RepID=UPI0036904119
MTYDGEPTIRLRRVGIELRRIRESANLTIHEAGRLLDRSPSSMSKVENGQVKLWKRELERILDRYCVTDPVLRDRLATLNENGRKKGWWLEYSGVADPLLLDYVSLEAEAEAICSFEPLLIPGLLQTEEYTRAVMSGDPVHGPAELEPFVALRMNRQRLLTRGSPPPIHLIVGETALRQVMGSREVMLDQLELLTELGRLDYLTLQVLPFSARGPAWFDGPFIILHVQPDHRVVVANHALGAVYTDLVEEVDRCTLVFKKLRAVALSTEESLAFIQRVAGDL